MCEDWSMRRFVTCIFKNYSDKSQGIVLNKEDASSQLEDPAAHMVSLHIPSDSQDDDNKSGQNIA